MICQRCGNSVLDTDDMCPICGNDLSKKIIPKSKTLIKKIKKVNKQVTEIPSKNTIILEILSIGLSLITLLVVLLKQFSIISLSYTSFTLIVYGLLILAFLISIISMLLSKNIKSSILVCLIITMVLFTLIYINKHKLEEKKRNKEITIEEQEITVHFPGKYFQTAENNKNTVIFKDGKSSITLLYTSKLNIGNVRNSEVNKKVIDSYCSALQHIRPINCGGVSLKLTNGKNYYIRYNFKNANSGYYAIFIAPYSDYIASFEIKNDKDNRQKVLFLKNSEHYLLNNLKFKNTDIKNKQEIPKYDENPKPSNGWDDMKYQLTEDYQRHADARISALPLGFHFYKYKNYKVYLAIFNTPVGKNISHDELVKAINLEESMIISSKTIDSSSGSWQNVMTEKRNVLNDKNNSRSNKITEASYEYFYTHSNDTGRTYGFVIINNEKNDNIYKVVRDDTISFLDNVKFYK